MKIRNIFLALVGAGAIYAIAAPVKKNVVDEVVWIVGDEAIFRSDVEEQYAQLRSEGTAIDGDPYCVIPEQMAVEKLYLHQAKIDTLAPSESMVASEADKRIQFLINNLGTKEKVEEYFRKSIPALREQMIEATRNGYIVNMVQRKLTEKLTSTPKDVRDYYNQLPDDSIPFIPMLVEAQIITINPVIPQQEIEDVKARLRDYADRVNRGESNFSTLAIMYSEDKGSAMNGGELGFAPRSAYVPEFSQVAFNLNDPKKVSRVVETEYGYHIIQLIQKRGDEANFRHILLSPKVSSKELSDAVVRLDSLRADIVADKFDFASAARYVSQDKDTKNNNGVMVNQNQRGINAGSSRFEMSELPTEVAEKISKMEVGDISQAFIMRDERKNKDVVAIVKLTNRIPAHRATLTDDYNLIKQMYLEHHKQDILTNWVENKIKDTYIKISDGWDKCDFKYKGWIK